MLDCKGFGTRIGRENKRLTPAIMDRHRKTPEENDDDEATTVHGKIIPINKEAQLAQLQQFILKFKKALQFGLEVLDVMEGNPISEPDPQPQEQG